MFDAETIVQELLQDLPDYSRLIIGFSGGLDSTVLLHILAHSELKPHLAAIHVNHQLSDKAAHWQRHCENIGASWGIPVQSIQVTVSQTGKGIENAARDARYQAFLDQLKEDDALCLAHHQDDLAETFLFRILRGAGLSGLIGLRSQSKFKNTTLLRPLLNTTRKQILAYATEHRLHWIEDESNSNILFDRNFLRHEIFPKLTERWPQATKQIFQTTQWLDEADSLLSEYAQEDLNACDMRDERYGQSIDLTTFKQFSVARQKHIIRAWINSNDFLQPSAAQLQQLDNVINAREDAEPQLEIASYQFRRFKSRLYLLKTIPPPAPFELSWDGLSPLILPDKSVLSCHLVENHLVENKDERSEKNFSFIIKARSGGERCKPLGRDKSQTLKKLLQEYELEPWLRDRIPLVYLNEELVGVGDLFLCEHPKLRSLTFSWEQAEC